MSDSHKPELAHHFNTYQQQRESCTLGMWLFVAQEVLFFGGLFATYVVYRNMYHDAFVYGSSKLNVSLGFINTLVLILSSVTMALAVREAQLGRNKGIIKFLAATFLFGAMFLGIKTVEYKGKWEHNLVPGIHFNYDPSHEAHSEGAASENPAVDHHEVVVADAVEAPSQEKSHAIDPANIDPGHLQIFFAVYFAMTGMHALHMIIGMGIIIFMMIQASRNKYIPQSHAFVENFGLYWHFVDLIWIFLFPLLYLLGRHI